MKRFVLLETNVIGTDYDDFRWFIDGKRVTQDDYLALSKQAKNSEPPKSYKFAGRTHFRSVIYV